MIGTIESFIWLDTSLNDFDFYSRSQTCENAETSVLFSPQISEINLHEICNAAMTCWSVQIHTNLFTHNSYSRERTQFL